MVQQLSKQKEAEAARAQELERVNQQLGAERAQLLARFREASAQARRAAAKQTRAPAPVRAGACAGV